jgi:hypothetical protein
VKHFAMAQWTDFVRGVAVAERDSMERHLSECQSCARVAGTLQRLARVAATESAPEVPEYLVRNAQAMFSLNKPEKVSVSRLIAQLMFDSFREPLAAGVRSQSALSRHALFEAGVYCIDLRIEYKKGEDEVDMIGQVVNKQDPNATASNLKVMLFSGEESLAETRTNEFGEFQMDYVPGRRLCLRIPVGNDCIEVPLAGVAGRR